MASKNRGFKKTLILVAKKAFKRKGKPHPLQNAQGKAKALPLCTLGMEQTAFLRATSVLKQAVSQGFLRKSLFQYKVFLASSVSFPIILPVKRPFKTRMGTLNTCLKQYKVFLAIEHMRSCQVMIMLESCMRSLPLREP